MTCFTPTRLQLVPAPASEVGAPLTDEVPPRSDASGDHTSSSTAQSLVFEGPARKTFAGDRRSSLRLLRERGMATAEYAVGLIAACAFAGVLLTVIRSGTVSGLILKLATAALAII